MVQYSEKNDYVNYQGMVTSVTTGISQLEGVCRHLSMDAQADDLIKINDHLKNHVFSVGIMGEFRRGKSTVINALLGQDIVPADIVPCSATLNYVRWDANKRAEIHFKDGTTKEVPVDELSRYVTKITKESEAMAANVEDAIVYYPCQFCQNGVQIVDTPGLNDDERMTSISENVIPTLDAIVMVIVPDSPFSQSEAEFVRNKVMSSDLGRIIFVVNKIDTIDEEDRPRLLKSIKEKIQDSVLEKMRAVYGENSDEYQNTKNKIGEIRLLPISARKALKGKMKNDLSQVEDSGYLEFEKMLSKLLTEERGILELIHPVNQMLSTAKDISQNIDTRLNAMKLDAEEFERIQTQSMEKIKETRDRKKEEIKIWKAQGKTTYADLLPDINSTYDEIDSTLCTYVDEYPISESDLASESSLQNLTEVISHNISEEMESILAIHTERLMAKVQERLGDDIEKLEVFANEFKENMDEIHIHISGNNAANNGGIIKNTLIDVGGMYGSLAAFGASIPGLGGLIAGFREHGLKGAAVGGLSGTALGFAALFGAFSLGIVGLPLALISGAASTFGGKAITNLIFGKQKKNVISSVALRDSLNDSVHGIVKKFREDRMLESWLEKTCSQLYDEVAENVDREWENSLKTMEETLTKIQIDLKMKEKNKEKVETDMKEYAATLNNVLETIHPINTKLSEALNMN